MADRRVHFVGIGGIGMSGIARVLIQKGVAVSGSDAKESSITKDLRARGAIVSIGHAAENVRDVCELVVSSAIRQDNPELVQARKLGIKITHRAQKLAELVNSYRGIAIGGTHGKTTTSSMVTSMMCHAGLAPSYVVGGIINTRSDNGGAGDSEWFVIEADESDGTLVEFRPEVAILTNVELDHMDYYRDVEHLNQVFATYLQNAKPNGSCVWCADDPGVRNLVRKLDLVSSTSYGIEHEADLTAKHVLLAGLGSAYDLYWKGKLLGPIRLCVPGLHNVLNSLAAVAAGLHVGLSYEQIAAGLESFCGVRRRFQIIGRNENYIVVDDYAHHPSEIRATLSAARASSDDIRIIGIFQPHRYSRTQSFAKDFGAAFCQADEVVITDIYGAGEDPIPMVTSDLIIQSLHENQHPSVHFVQGLDNVEDYVARLMRPNDMVITLGAGDIWKVAESLSKRLIA